MEFSLNQGAQSGFTMVEVLTVIAIIAILVGLLVPSVNYVQYQSKKTSTQADLQRISKGLESFHSTFGNYPPSTLNGRKDHEGNRINQGAESITAWLMSEKRGGPYLEWPDKRYANTDEDRANQNLTGWFFGHNRLMEMTDVWRNPVIYFHHRDYDHSEPYSTYQRRSGQTVQAQPRKEGKTGAFRGKFSFQLWSMGADGQPGTSEDIWP